MELSGHGGSSKVWAFIKRNPKQTGIILILVGVCMPLVLYLFTTHHPNVSRSFFRSPPLPTEFLPFLYQKGLRNLYLVLVKGREVKVYDETDEQFEKRRDLWVAHEKIVSEALEYGLPPPPLETRLFHPQFFHMEARGFRIIIPYKIPLAIGIILVFIGVGMILLSKPIREPKRIGIVLILVGICMPLVLYIFTTPYPYDLRHKISYTIPLAIGIILFFIGVGMILLSRRGKEEHFP